MVRSGKMSDEQSYARLDGWLQQRGKMLHIRDVMTVVKRLAQVLHDMHQDGLTLGQWDPANILVYDDGVSIDWLIDLLVSWLIDWLIDCWVGGWLVGWLIDCLFDWLLDCLVDWLVGWSICWLIDWLIVWSIDWLIVLSIGWLIGWLLDWWSSQCMWDSLSWLRVRFLMSIYLFQGRINLKHYGSI